MEQGADQPSAVQREDGQPIDQEQPGIEESNEQGAQVEYGGDLCVPKQVGEACQQQVGNRPSGSPEELTPGGPGGRPDLGSFPESHQGQSNGSPASHPAGNPPMGQDVEGEGERHQDRDKHGSNPGSGAAQVLTEHRQKISDDRPDANRED